MVLIFQVYVTDQIIIFLVYFDSHYNFFCLDDKENRESSYVKKIQPEFSFDL